MPSLQLAFGPLVVDLEHYRIVFNGRPLALPYREYALLVYLAGRAGQVVQKRQLLEEGLGRHDWEGLRVVDEQMRHLRGVLERAGCPVLEEVSEVGYRFDPALLNGRASVTSN